jgi:hypothetical protein
MIGAFLLATTLNVSSLPPIEHIDCEVSTNVAFDVSSKMIECRMGLSLLSTSSNVVEVAFGKDVDLDSNLSRVEKELIICCECGLWKIFNTINGKECIFDNKYGECMLDLCFYFSSDKKECRTSLSLNGVPLNVARDVSFFNKDWTHMKVISRGDSQCFRDLSVQQVNGRFYIRIQ